MSGEVTSAGEFVVPTAEGVTDFVQAIEANMRAGKWVMMAPDGRTWMTEDALILFAALASEIQGKSLQFEPPLSS